MKSCVDCVIQQYAQIVACDKENTEASRSFKSYVIEGFGEPFPYELYVPCITKSPSWFNFRLDLSPLTSPLNRPGLLSKRHRKFRQPKAAFFSRHTGRSSVFTREGSRDKGST